MILRIAVTLGTLVALTAGAAARPAAAPSAASMAADLRTHGAAVVVAELVSSGRWEAVTERMAGGDARWIHLAPALASQADGGFAEGLGIALAYALPKNPQAVLGALAPMPTAVLGVKRVCGMPFIEDTVRDRGAYRRRALRAVASVPDAALRRERALCLATLRRSR